MEIETKSVIWILFKITCTIKAALNGVEYISPVSKDPSIDSISSIQVSIWLSTWQDDPNNIAYPTDVDYYSVHFKIQHSTASLRHACGLVFASGRIDKDTRNFQFHPYPPSAQDEDGKVFQNMIEKFDRGSESSQEFTMLHIWIVYLHPQLHPVAEKYASMGFMCPTELKHFEGIPPFFRDYLTTKYEKLVSNNVNPLKLAYFFPKDDPSPIPVHLSILLANGINPD